MREASEAATCGLVGVDAAVPAEPAMRDNLLPIAPDAATVARFWSKVEVSEGCWLWLGGCDKEGYGRFWANGRTVKAHRFAYTIVVGPIPEGRILDHVKDRGCTRKDCVNPAHLEPVTDRVNIRRGSAPAATGAARTHCIHGHPFDAKNTLISHRRRNCRTCMAERKRREHERRRSANDLSQPCPGLVEQATETSITAKSAVECTFISRRK